jgi:tryptophan halogenase
MKIKKIAVVGGGTAGVVTALILRKTYDNLEIDLIESDKIGIVGVGEGSTEHWATFMQHCDISTTELIKNTDATFKYGINFENWTGDNSNYIHSISSAFNMSSQSNSKFVYSYLISKGAGPKDLVHKYIEQSLHRMPFFTINQFHFDTNKLNKFLHDLCDKRNIKTIKAEIKEVKLAEDGAISELISEDGRSFEYDLYIDCTGFHRLLLHKAMGVKWKSYNKYLPMNSAIAFPTETTEKIPSWTLSRAMTSGWLWRIPTQSRYGNGYVFNDNFISADQAVEEVEQYYGHKINVGKHVSFDAGCLEKFWVKNCVAIGLSSSFVEPLEASSIGCSIQQAFKLNQVLPSYMPGVNIEMAVNAFNTECDELLDNILDYIALHYVTKRDDTEFWKSTHSLPKPAGLEERLEMYKHKMPNPSEFLNRKVMFKEANWIVVMHGLGLISQEAAQADVDMQPKHLVESIPYNLPKEDLTSTEFHDHRYALQWLMDNPEQM